MSAFPTTELLQEALALHRRGAFSEAALRYAAVLRADPANADAHYYLAMISCQQGRFAEGADLAGKSLAADPQQPRAHVLLGRALSALGRPADALASFDCAIAFAPDFAQAHGNRANVLSDLGRTAEAIASYDRALVLAPESVEDWFNRGLALAAVDRHDDAMSSFDRAIALKSDFAEAHFSRGNALARLKRRDEALASFAAALAIDPRHMGALNNTGSILRELGRDTESLAAYDRALALDPNFADAWSNRANTLNNLLRFDEALVSAEKALALEPNQVEALFNLGRALASLKRYAAAASCFQQVLALKPGHRYAYGSLASCQLAACNWDETIAIERELHAKIAAGKSVITPLTVLGYSNSPADQLAAAGHFAHDIMPDISPPVRSWPARRPDKVRVAYVSADFGDHAVINLIAGLLERHDRSKFDVIGVSTGRDDASEIRRRVARAFGNFYDVQDGDDQSIAKFIADLSIDIAVDLTGYTENARPKILAQRPAPIQVNYLGYIGTMAVDFIDYVIADKIALPSDLQPYYTEKIVHLPGCFLPTDSQQEIAPRTPSPKDAGLPPEGFVFCSFNNSYKLGRPMFELWMRLLHVVEGSVLWLLESNTDMAGNLLREAQRCGIAPERIVFAPRVALSEHMARQRLAGLFLDTTPYNAGATAVASLWSGVPVLTMIGATFVGRMAASMLHAVGLPELVTNSLDDYEALALKIATNPDFLASIQRKMHDNLRRTPLFDTDRYCRHLEQAYLTMVDIRLRGEPARGFAVEPM
jgi:protein O-GlcNAc transferase